MSSPVYPMVLQNKKQKQKIFPILKNYGYNSDEHFEDLISTGKSDIFAQIPVNFYNFLNFIFFSPSRLKYDSNSGKYICKGFNPIFKIIVLFNHVFNIVSFTGGIIDNSEPNVKQKIITRIFLIGLFLFFSSFYYTLWTKSGKICSLFNNVEDSIKFLKYDTKNLPSKRLIKYLTWISIFYYFIFGLLYGLNYAKFFECLSIHPVDGEFFMKFLEFSYNVSRTRLTHIFGQSIPQTDDLHNGVKIPLGIYALISAIYSSYGWILGQAIVVYWSVYFSLILRTLLKNLKNSISIVQMIRSFNRLTLLIEDFNEIMGSIIFFSFLGSAIYLAVYFWEIFKGELFIDLFLSISSFFTFTILLLISALVNNYAIQIKDEIQILYQNRRHWKELVNNSKEETSQGLIITYSNLQNVGINGFGFFTMTFSFYGSVMSAIATYSVVVLQLVEPTSTT